MHTCIVLVGQPSAAPFMPMALYKDIATKRIIILKLNQVHHFITQGIYTSQQDM